MTQTKCKLPQKWPLCYGGSYLDTTSPLSVIFVPLQGDPFIAQLYCIPTSWNSTWNRRHGSYLHIAFAKKVKKYAFQIFVVVLHSCFRLLKKKSLHGLFCTLFVFFVDWCTEVLWLLITSKFVYLNKVAIWQKHQMKLKM